MCKNHNKRLLSLVCDNWNKASTLIIVLEGYYKFSTNGQTKFAIISGCEYEWCKRIQSGQEVLAKLRDYGNYFVSDVQKSGHQGLTHHYFLSCVYDMSYSSHDWKNYYIVNGWWVCYDTIITVGGGYVWPNHADLSTCKWGMLEIETQMLPDKLDPPTPESNSDSYPIWLNCGLFSR